MILTLTLTLRVLPLSQPMLPESVDETLLNLDDLFAEDSFDGGVKDISVFSLSSLANDSVDETLIDLDDLFVEDSFENGTKDISVLSVSLLTTDCGDADSDNVYSCRCCLSLNLVLWRAMQHLLNLLKLSSQSL